MFAGVRRDEVNGNGHGLHKYPAKFIPHIPRWALEYADAADKARKVVLDPFCGSGTTLVEAGLRGHASIGVDISPLAVLISRAKTATLPPIAATPTKLLRALLKRADTAARGFERRLAINDPTLGLHDTWTNWFDAKPLARLLALRSAIETTIDDKEELLRDFLLVCLSSIAKSSSHLSEDQIKVRYDHLKRPADPFEAFAKFAAKALPSQHAVGRRLADAGATTQCTCCSATNLPLGRNSVDLIVTSPPYINAVDYTMAHKYNLLLLGLIRPEQFKDHCRDYVGMTERAVRTRDSSVLPSVGVESVDRIVRRVSRADSPVAANRAFVVASFFLGMKKAFVECRRVLRDGRPLVMVIGSTNRICGELIETARLTEALGHHAGFVTDLRFYHELANRSSMRLNRNTAGGQVKTEAILVLR